MASLMPHKTHAVAASRERSERRRRKPCPVTLGLKHRPEIRQAYAAVSSAAYLTLTAKT